VRSNYGDRFQGDWVCGQSLCAQEEGTLRTLSDNGGYERSAHLYDLFDQKANIGFFFNYASQVKEVLDIGAGTGRIALPVAKRGVKVVCIEPSPAMRREFETKLAQQPDLSTRIDLLPGAASSFSLDRTFSAAFLSGSFDHFLDDAERISSLANIARHLHRKGTLLFDVFLGLMGDSPLSPSGWVKAGAREYRRSVGGKVLAGQRKETHLVFETYEGGKLTERVEEISLTGITSRPGIHRVLRDSGFSVRTEWGDYDYTPYQEGDSLLILEAVKRD
jgi:SAM-dependent methyltransferase